jgi:heme exporter protein C
MMRRAFLPMAAIAAAMFAYAPFMILAAPYESTMGLVQKIFYFHAPVAMTLFLAAFVCGIASALYLFRRTPQADFVAIAAAELTVVLGTIVLVTGPLWARKAWGVWWDWEPRLVSTLVMWLIFVAYLLLRR